MSDDAYAGFAERYDRFHGRFGRHDPHEVEFFRRLFAENHVRSVLDCACGTGHHLPLFLSLGCEVTGSDISPSMLAQAESNLAGAGLHVPLHRVDYRELSQRFSQPFDAVMCLSSSILHMPDETELLRALTSMRAVLREGGILVLTQGTSDRQWREQPRFLLVADDPDLTRLFTVDYFGEGARYNVLDVCHGDPPELKVWSVDYPHVWLRDDQERLLRRAGFRTVGFYGSFGLEPYDKENSRRLIAVARP